MAADDPPGNPSDNIRTRVVDNGAPLALANGTLLGRYRIDGVLGQGGFGITYRATDSALNRAVAIKEYLPSDVAIRIDGSTVIPRSRADAEDYNWGLKRFLDEAKTLAQHEAVPNVVRVYDFVEANGTAYMIMALVEGDNLSTILKQRQTLNEQELHAIALPLLDGLEQLHDAGMIHRDIKPANIILRAGRGPTLIDFGAAREGLGRKSRSVTSILTPGYAPFEQYGSAGDQGPWTDLYALAATLYHCVAGKPPPDSVDRIRRDPMVPALQAGAGRYSEAFLAAIDAGLRVDERERPQSAAQWRSMFAGDATAASPTLQPVSLKPSAVPAAAPPPPTPSALAAPPSARVGSRKMLIAAGAAALLVAGGTAIALTMNSGTPPASVAPVPAASDPARTEIALAEQRRVADSQTRAAEQAENARKLQAQAAEAEKIRRAEQEKRIAEEAENRRRLEALIAEARRQTEEELRRKAVEEARLKAELDAREKAEAEDRRRLEEDTRRKVEAEFKARAEMEARQRQVEEEARRKTEEARLKADEAKRKVEDARKKVEEPRQKVEQRTSDAPPAAPAAAVPQQAAVVAPAWQGNPAAYVAQHWPTMRAQVEAAINKRGVITDPVSGVGMRLGQIYGYRLINAGPDAIVLTVNYRNVRAVPGGVMTGNSADLSETATFQNQPPAFPLVSLK